jgi:hypothetical protein
VSYYLKINPNIVFLTTDKEGNTWPSFRKWYPLHVAKLNMEFKDCDSFEDAFPEVPAANEADLPAGVKKLFSEDLKETTIKVLNKNHKFSVAVFQVVSALNTITTNSTAGEGVMGVLAIQLIDLFGLEDGDVYMV